MRAARALLAGQPGSYDASLAHQAIGIVLRDHGDLPGAVAELRKALRLARGSGRPEREADVRASLGVALAWRGRSQQGLTMLDQAVAATHGNAAGRVLMRRANVRWDLGRFRDAYQDLCRALPYFRRAGDSVWEARSLTWRGFVFLSLGLPGRAAADFARAEDLFATSGQDLEYAYARHNRGLAPLSSRRPPRGPGLFRRSREPLPRARPGCPGARHRPLLGAADGWAGQGSSPGDRNRAQPDTSSGRERVQARGTGLLRGYRGPGCGRPGPRAGAGQPSWSAVPGPTAAGLGAARRPGPCPGQVRGQGPLGRPVPRRRAGRGEPGRGPGRCGPAGASAGRAAGAEPGAQRRSGPASRAGREVTPPQAAADP